MQVFDFSGKVHIGSKKFDFVRVAYILQHCQNLTANQIQYYYSQMFGQILTSRIAQILRQKPKAFEIEKNKDMNLMVYSFNGEIKLNRHTQRLWSNKSKKVF